MSVVQLIPSGDGWTDADISASAKIAGSKLRCRRSIDVELAGPTTNIAALTKLLHICRAGTKLVQVEAIITGAATGDRTATVAIQRSTGGAAFSTIMSANISISSGTSVRTAVMGTFSVTDLVDGDILQAVVTVGGATGTQPQGLLLTLTYDEDPS